MLSSSRNVDNQAQGIAAAAEEMVATVKEVVLLIRQKMLKM